MVVAAGEVGGEDEGEAAGGTGGGEGADFGAAARAEVAGAGGARVAGAEGAGGFDDARGEAHHQERARAVVVGGGGGGGVGAVRGFGGHGRGGDVHDEVAEVLFVEGDAVGFVGGAARVGACDEGAADGDLGGEADDGGADGGGGERGDGRVDVARVRGQERAEDEEDFARAVGGRVAGIMALGVSDGTVGVGRKSGGCVQESGAGHVERVL